MCVENWPTGLRAERMSYRIYREHNDLISLPSSLRKGKLAKKT
jgi:hypothetical protein